MGDVPRTTSLEWRAHSLEGASSALDEFAECIDGPVRRWLDTHSSVSAIRAEADPGAGEVNGSIVRTVSVLDTVLGNVDAAMDRLLDYRRHVSRSDSPQRVDAFIEWLKQAAAERSRAPGSP